MLWKRFVLAPHERGLVIKNGRFGGIFAPGQYAMFLPSGVLLEIERHDVRDVVLRSAWVNYLVEKRPGLSRRHFHCVQTNAAQIAMVYVDGKLFQVLTPSKRMLFWRDAAAVTAELVEVVGPSRDRAVASPRGGTDSLTIASLARPSGPAAIFTLFWSLRFHSLSRC